MTPLVSIIIPCRNEERYIDRCLMSIIANDYPKDRLEVLVVDGESTDITRSLIAGISKKYPYIKLLHNPKKITPSALNIGIKKAKGEFIIRMDAHSEYKSNYISLCVQNSIQYNADNVGGIFASTAPVDTLIAHSIVEAMSTFFGVGNSYFRTYPKKYKEVDTVAYGCYPKRVFNRQGTMYFNEYLERCQDIDLNMRIKALGGKIILFPDIIAYYYTEATFGKFWEHNFKDGVWATYSYKFMRARLKWRHLLPFFFVMSLVASVGVSGWLTLFGLSIYIISNLIASFLVALRKRDGRYMVSMPIAYTIRHFAYGLGSVWGTCKLFINYQNPYGKNERRRNTKS